MRLRCHLRQQSQSSCCPSQKYGSIATARSISLIFLEYALAIPNVKMIDACTMSGRAHKSRDASLHDVKHLTYQLLGLINEALRFEMNMFRSRSLVSGFLDMAPEIMQNNGMWKRTALVTAL
mmetsp:Transcript_20938/g.66047  ORF Transcript_20938/g.66047 Transcript_20938/m.66047 type:complete len:122 (-) Transcript_20938:303-668(-)